MAALRKDSMRFQALIALMCSLCSDDNSDGTTTG